MKYNHGIRCLASFFIAFPFSQFLWKKNEIFSDFFHLSLILPSAVFFRILVFLYLYIWPCIPVSPYPHLLSLYLRNAVVLHSCIPLYSLVFSCILLYSPVFSCILLYSPVLACILLYSSIIPVQYPCIPVSPVSMHTLVSLYPI